MSAVVLRCWGLDLNLARVLEVKLVGSDDEMLSEQSEPYLIEHDDVSLAYLLNMFAVEAAARRR